MILYVIDCETLIKIEGYKLRLATRNRTGWLHMCVNLHAHVYNIVSGWYSMYDHVSDLGSITLLFVFNCN